MLSVQVSVRQWCPRRQQEGCAIATTFALQLRTFAWSPVVVVVVVVVVGIICATAAACTSLEEPASSATTSWSAKEAWCARGKHVVIWRQSVHCAACCPSGTISDVDAQFVLLTTGSFAPVESDARAPLVSEANTAKLPLRSGSFSMAVARVTVATTRLVAVAHIELRLGGVAFGPSSQFVLSEEFIFVQRSDEMEHSWR